MAGLGFGNGAGEAAVLVQGDAMASGSVVALRLMLPVGMPSALTLSKASGSL
jgi:hypothetical protein